MKKRRVMTHEEYERILKRIYSQGYVVNLREREKVKTVEDVAFYVPRLGYVVQFYLIFFLVSKMFRIFAIKSAMFL